MEILLYRQSDLFVVGEQTAKILFIKFKSIKARYLFEFALNKLLLNFMIFFYQLE